MQQLADLDVQADRVDVRPSRKRKTSARRKVTVRLSEGVCGRLDVATDRPGVGKSMLVEAALEHFLNPAPSVEALAARASRRYARQVRPSRARYADDRRDGRAARSISSGRHAAGSARAAARGGSSSATSASRSWPSRSIAAFGRVGLSCRRRSTASIAQTTDESGQATGEQARAQFDSQPQNESESCF